MCCRQAGQHGNAQGHHAKGHCCCGGMTSGQAFWSKKRKIKMLEHVLDCRREDVKDMEELLDELKNEK